MADSESAELQTGDNEPVDSLGAEEQDGSSVAVQKRSHNGANDTSNDDKEDGGSSGAPALSKRQLKRLKRDQQWLVWVHWAPSWK
jgi:hypothetical protein